MWTHGAFLSIPQGWRAWGSGKCSTTSKYPAFGTVTSQISLTDKLVLLYNNMDAGRGLHGLVHSRGVCGNCHFPVTSIEQ